MLLVKCLDGVGYKLGAVVRHNSIRNSEPSYDLLPKEVLNIDSRDRNERLGLHPLCIIVSGSNEVCETTGGFRQLPNDVNPPLGQGLEIGCKGRVRWW